MSDIANQAAKAELEQFGIRLDGTSDLVSTFDSWSPEELLRFAPHLTMLPRLIGIAMVAALKKEFAADLNRELRKRKIGGKGLKELLVLGRREVEELLSRGASREQILRDATSIAAGKKYLETLTLLLALLSCMLRALGRVEVCCTDRDLPARVNGDVAECSKSCIDIAYRVAILEELLSHYSDLCQIDIAVPPLVSEALNSLATRLRAAWPAVDLLRREGPLAPGGYLALSSITAESMHELSLKVGDRLINSLAVACNPIVAVAASQYRTHNFQLKALADPKVIDAAAVKVPRFDSVACIGGIRAEALQRTSANAGALRGEVNPQKFQLAWEYIREHPKCKALVIANHIGVAYTTFRKHYVPELKRRGVSNDGEGYYL